MRFFSRIEICMGLLGAGMLFYAASEARGHNWYPTRCCWSSSAAPAGRPGDCAKIPAESVKITATGYTVSLKPGDHPMVTKPITFEVPYSKAEVSHDQDFHVCFRQSDMGTRCFFSPPFGS